MDFFVLISKAIVTINTIRNKSIEPQRSHFFTKEGLDFKGLFESEHDLSKNQ